MLNYPIKLSALKVLSVTFLLTPLWWLLGAGFFIFHAAALFAAAASPQALRPRDAFQYLLLLLIALLCMSMMISAASGAADLARVVASLNNASILLNGYIIYSFLGHTFRTRPEALDQMISSLGKVGLVAVVLGIPCVYLLFFKGVNALTFPTVFGLLSPPQENLLGLYQRLILIDVDWFAESSVPRLTILSTNATSSAALIAFSGYFFLAALQRNRRVLAIAFIAALICVMAATLTRGAIVGLLAGIAIYSVLSLRRNRKLIVGLSIIVTTFSLTFAAPLFETINSARQASSSTRFAVYEMSLDVTMKQGPLIGLGVKPRTDQIAIPIGSHSAFLSILVRGGLIGAAIAILLFLVIPIAWFFRALNKSLQRGRLADPRAYSIPIIAALPSFLVFCIFQDIDAYAPLSAFLFAYLALLSFVANGNYFENTSNETTNARPTMTKYPMQRPQT